MPDPNRDLTAPICPLAYSIPLSVETLQDGSVPIFWGDNQFLSQDSEEYDRPSGMTQYAVLHVPKVIRFLYTYGEGDDIAADNHHDSGPPHYIWTLISFDNCIDFNNPINTPIVQPYLLVWSNNAQFDTYVNYRYNLDGSTAHPRTEYTLGETMDLVLPTRPSDVDPRRT